MMRVMGCEYFKDCDELGAKAADTEAGSGVVLVLVGVSAVVKRAEKAVRAELLLAVLGET